MADPIKVETKQASNRAKIEWQSQDPTAGIALHYVAVEMEDTEVRSTALMEEVKKVIKGVMEDAKETNQRRP